VDNPAVGANMDDHIAAFLEYKTNEKGLTAAHKVDTTYGLYKALAQFYLFGTGPLTKPGVEFFGFLKSGMSPPSVPVDIQQYLGIPYPFMDEPLHFTEATSKRRTVTPDHISFIFMTVLLHPSDKGEIRLQSADPFVHPIIEHHYLKTEKDLDIMTKGLRMLVDLAKRPEVKDFEPQYTEAPPPQCEKFERLSDEYLRCTIKDRALTLYHPVGTCRMGKKGNNSVVDNELRVHGVTGLRVVDTSVFPEQVSGNTHAPAIMVGEKAADLIKKAHH